MADLFRSFAPKRGGDVGWLSADPAGAILRTGFFGQPPAPPSAGLIKVWDGTAWVAKPVKVWSGSAWVIKPLKRWSGTAWV
jgi:hypothetical protein